MTSGSSCTSCIAEPIFLDVLQQRAERVEEIVREIVRNDLHALGTIGSKGSSKRLDRGVGLGPSSER